jgi:hypothetical protein
MSKKLLWLIVIAIIGTSAPSYANSVKCPTVLKSFVASDDTNLSKNWLLGGPRQTYILKGSRVFMGKLAEQSIQPASEVRPIPHMEDISDKKVFYQVWNLEYPRYRGNSLLVCDYAGSDNYLIYALEPEISKCSEINPMDKSEPTRVECQ